MPHVANLVPARSDATDGTRAASLGAEPGCLQLGSLTLTAPESPLLPRLMYGRIALAWFCATGLQARRHHSSMAVWLNRLLTAVSKSAAVLLACAASAPLSARLLRRTFILRWRPSGSGPVWTRVSAGSWPQATRHRRVQIGPTVQYSIRPRAPFGQREQRFVQFAMEASAMGSQNAAGRSHHLPVPIPETDVASPCPMAATRLAFSTDLAARQHCARARRTGWLLGLNAALIPDGSRSVRTCSIGARCFLSD